MDGSHWVSRETAAPPVFGKETGLRFLVFVAAFLCAVPTVALDISVNGIPGRRYSAAELDALSYPVSRGDRGEIRGVSLGELFPLVEEAWRLEAVSATGTRSWEAGELGERLFDLFLLRSPDGVWYVEIDGAAFRGPDRLDIGADLLAEDGIEFWASWEGVKAMKEEVARFASSHARTVKVVEVPNTQTKLLAVARAGGKLPDLAMIQSDYVPALAAAGIIQAADRLRTGNLLAKGFDSFLDQGKSWAVPLYFDSQLVFYRPSIVGGRLPPDCTLEELESRARKLKGKIDAPLCWNAYSAYWLLPFVAGFGRQAIVDAEGNMAIDDAPSALALGRLLRMKDEGLLVPLERDAMTSWFVAGKAGYILSSSYDIPAFEEIGLDFAVATYPLIASTGRAVAPLLDFKGLAVSRRTEKPVLARRLLQFLTAPGFQARFTSKMSKFPVNRVAIELSRSGNRYFEQLTKSYEIGLVVPPAKAYGAYKNVMWKLLRFLFTGQMDAAQVLSTAARLVEESLKEE